MRVALAALESLAGDVEGNLRRLERAVADHAGWGIDLLVVSECFVQGFGGATFDITHDHEIAWELDGPQMRRLRRLAKQHQMALCVGYLEREREHLYSSAVVLSREGATIANYRRISLGWRFGDEDPAVYREGTTAPLFTLAGKQCTVALCGDLWADDLSPWHDLRPDVVLWPVYVSFTADEWQTELDQYARQANKVYAHALMVNAVDGDDAIGGAAWFRNAKVKAQGRFDGSPEVLVIDVL